MAEVSAELKTLREKTERYLRQMEVTYEVAKDVYRVRRGSSVVILDPRQWDEKSTFVRFLGIVLDKVKKNGNEAMFEEFSQINDNTVLGKIYWSPSKDDANTGGIYYETVLLGEYLDFEEFSESLVAVAVTADELDDKLQAKYGGERWSD